MKRSSYAKLTCSMYDTRQQYLCNLLIFFQWKDDANLKEIQVIRRYHLPSRDEYHKWVALKHFVINMTDIQSSDTIDFVAQSVNLFTAFPSFPPTTLYEARCNPQSCPNYTTWAYSTQSQS